MLVLFALLVPAELEEFEVPPRPIEWGALGEDQFDRAWCLPDPRRADGRDLLEEMRTLVALEFEATDREGRRMRSFGDLVRVARELDPSERVAWLDALETRPPTILRDWGAGLRQLILDDELRSSDWEPSDDLDRDGLVTAETWDMRGEESEPWTRIRVRPRMEQAAALVHADLATIKAVENDYRLYPNNAGADYEEIFPLAETYRVGRDPSDRPFSTLTIRFRCDLPFPFGGYTTVLDILSRFDEDGTLVTDIHSASDDFHWLAGRDVFLPVESSDGEWVTTLVVRHFGFDLDGVPDKSKNRREALRGTLGNLKRNAEAAWRAAAEPKPNNAPQFLADVRVFGVRAK